MENEGTRGLMDAHTLEARNLEASGISLQDTFISNLDMVESSDRTRMVTCYRCIEQTAVIV